MIVLLILIWGVISKPIVPRKVTQAIDCGGHLVQRTSFGVKFSQDIGNEQEGTERVDYYLEPQLTRPKIRYSEDTPLYMTQRQGSQPFQYRLSLGKDIPDVATYVLVLKFAELHFTENEQRVFNVAVGTRVLIENLDVHALVGHSTAHDEYLELQMDFGKVFYQGQLCPNAIDKKNQIVVEFQPVIDRPMISALFLYQGTLNETDYYDREEYKAKWEQINSNLTWEEKRNKRQERADELQNILNEKQSKIKIRDGFQHEIEKQIDEAPKKKRMEWPAFSFELLFAMLMTPLGGILLVGFLTVLYVTIAFTFFDPYGQKKLQAQVKELREQKIRQYKNQLPSPLKGSGKQD